MATRIKDTGKTQARIKVRGKTEKRVSPEVVSKALGASPVGDEREGSEGSPYTLVAIFQEIVQRLESSGGRPKLRHTTRRQKIPLAESDWSQLNDISEMLREHNVSTSPGQVASMLIHNSLERLDLAAIKDNVLTKE